MFAFDIQTKRRLYTVYIEFDPKGEQYELEIKGHFGRRKKEVSAWQEIEITSDPLQWAQREIVRYELREEYEEKYSDKVFSLNGEQVAEIVKEMHEVPVNDWEAGKAVVRWEAKAKEAKKKAK